MRREFEIQGCLEVSAEVDIDLLTEEFIRWVESKGWYFGGGFREIADGYYVLPDGSKGKSVWEE